VLGTVDANDEIFKKILDDEHFLATLGEFYLRKLPLGGSDETAGETRLKLA
jgi:hypothetical protein